MSLPRELRQQIPVQSIDDSQTELDVYKFTSSHHYPWNWFEAFTDYQEKAKSQAKVLEVISKKMNNDMIGDVHYAVEQSKRGYEKALAVLQQDYETPPMTIWTAPWVSNDSELIYPSTYTNTTVVV